jgi:hypothetical protein
MKPLPRRARATRRAPEVDHAIMSEAEQSRFLGRGDEVTMNLGHRVKQNDLTRHPLGQPINYDTAPQGQREIKEGQRLTQGVYGRHAPINSGVSTDTENLRAWGKYSTSNSYAGKDPRGRGEGSDGHLASTKNWAGFEYGSESGLGRIEKTHSRK